MKSFNVLFYYLLILFLLIFSVGSVAYNSAKIFSEYNEWGRLTDFQKRDKLFGNFYERYLFINNHTPNSAKILLYSSDGMEYYVLRYYLYPKKIFYTTSKDEFVSQAMSKQYVYMVASDTNLQLEGYDKKVSSNNKKQSFILFIKK
jgi:hypothetical protein